MYIKSEVLSDAFWYYMYNTLDKLDIKVLSIQY